MIPYICLECGTSQYSAGEPQAHYFPQCIKTNCRGEVVPSKDLGMLELIANAGEPINETMHNTPGKKREIRPGNQF